MCTFATLTWPRLANIADGFNLVGIVPLLLAESWLQHELQCQKFHVTALADKLTSSIAADKIASLGRYDGMGPATYWAAAPSLADLTCGTWHCLLDAFTALTCTLWSAEALTCACVQPEQHSHSRCCVLLAK